ncbi:MAG: hypothetical protein WBP26_05900 [Candidatus Saccharimonadales bacterium]
MGFSGRSSSAISSATDVALNNPSNNQILVYDGTVGKWKNAAAPGGSIDYSGLPAGTNISADYDIGSASYPARPTNRTDIIVIWRGPTEPPAMLNGDEWKVTP